MKLNSILHSGLVFAGCCLLPFALCLRVSAQGTAFTYQGRLNDGVAPANGTYDLQFAVYNAASGGSKQADFLTNSATAVSNGLFTVTLDFGPGVFPGAPRWLDIGVRTNGTGAFTLLSPRQALTATPYAVFAGGASNLVGALSSANLAGTYSKAVTLNNPGNVFTGNGTGVTNVNAVTLNGLTAENFWQLGGNNVSAGQFLGSTNDQPVDFKVYGYRALRLEPGLLGVPNVIGGASVNYINPSQIGSVIAGGGADSFLGHYTNGIVANFAFIGGGGNNTITADFSALGGGQDNSILNNSHHAFLGGGNANTIGANSWDSVLGGGEGNSIQGSYDTFLGGGYHNFIGANSHYATLGGGLFNVIQAGASYSTIAGGDQNVISTDDSFNSYSSIGGGLFNVINANSSSSTISGGFNNIVQTNATTATISGGGINTIQQFAFSATIGGGSYNTIQSNSYYTTIDGGENNLIGINAHHAAVGGGQINTIQNGANSSVIGGGYANTIWAFANASVIGGGYNNAIRQSANLSFLGGGLENFLGELAYSSVLVGGFTNRIDNRIAYGFIGGGRENAIEEYDAGAFIFTGGMTALLPPAQYSSIVGGEKNRIAPGYSFGFGFAASPAEHSSLAGGYSNRISSAFCFLGGGAANVIGGFGNYSFIGGGNNNFVGNGSSHFLGGGSQNSISGGSGSFIGGGRNNVMEFLASGGSSLPSYSVIGGGYGNTNTGAYATVPGGASNSAAGNFSFAAGQLAKANHQGTFVWADSTPTSFVSTAADQFSVRAAGGVRFFSNAATNAGVSLAAGGTAWAVISDRNVKKDFAAVDSVSILEKLAALPITQWHYQWEAKDITPHIGPMAQDFKAAFYPGSDDKSISTLEADGVAFAAIQGLNEKVESRRQESEARSRKLEAENAELKARLEKLEELINKTINGGAK